MKSDAHSPIRDAVPASLPDCGNAHFPAYERAAFVATPQRVSCLASAKEGPP